MTQVLLLCGNLLAKMDSKQGCVVYTKTTSPMSVTLDGQYHCFCWYLIDGKLCALLHCRLRGCRFKYTPCTLLRIKVSAKLTYSFDFCQYADSEMEYVCSFSLVFVT